MKHTILIILILNISGVFLFANPIEKTNNIPQNYLQKVSNYIKSNPLENCYNQTNDPFFKVIGSFKIESKYLFLLANGEYSQILVVTPQNEIIATSIYGLSPRKIQIINSNYVCINFRVNFSDLTQEKNILFLLNDSSIDECATFLNYSGKGDLYWPDFSYQILSDYTVLNNSNRADSFNIKVDYYLFKYENYTNSLLWQKLYNISFDIQNGTILDIKSNIGNVQASTLLAYLKETDNKDKLFVEILLKANDKFTNIIDLNTDDILLFTKMGSHSILTLAKSLDNVFAIKETKKDNKLSQMQLNRNVSNNPETTFFIKNGSFCEKDIEDYTLAFPNYASRNDSIFSYQIIGRIKNNTDIKSIIAAMELEFGKPNYSEINNDKSYYWEQNKESKNISKNNASYSDFLLMESNSLFFSPLVNEIVTTRIQLNTHPEKFKSSFSIKIDKYVSKNSKK